MSLQLSRSSTHDRRMQRVAATFKGPSDGGLVHPHERLCRGDDSVGTDAIVPVKIDQGPVRPKCRGIPYGALRGTRPARSRSMCEREWTRPLSRARCAAVHPA